MLRTVNTPLCWNTHWADFIDCLTQVFFRSKIIFLDKFISHKFDLFKLFAWARNIFKYFFEAVLVSNSLHRKFFIVSELLALHSKLHLMLSLVAHLQLLKQLLLISQVLTFELDSLFLPSCYFCGLLQVALSPLFFIGWRTLKIKIYFRNWFLFNDHRALCDAPFVALYIKHH